MKKYELTGRKYQKILTENGFNQTTFAKKVSELWKRKVEHDRVWRAISKNEFETVAPIWIDALWEILGEETMNAYLRGDIGLSDSNVKKSSIEELADEEFDRWLSQETFPVPDKNMMKDIWKSYEKAKAQNPNNIRTVEDFQNERKSEL